MPLVHIISAFLTLAPESIQILGYMYVSMRTAKLGNTFMKLLGKLHFFFKKSKRNAVFNLH